jgi:hypothetical protein
LKAADLAPRFLLPSLSVLLGRRLREREILAATALSAAQWRDLGHAYPRLGPDPGPGAARARRRYGYLVGQALETRGPRPQFRDASPNPSPGVYATAHVGDLRSLRYLLRREIAVATVVVATEEERADLARADRDFDLGAPRDFPHVLSSRQPHRLRAALRRGSLIVSADLPERDGTPFPVLGGQLRLDPRPFRLARVCEVPCRPVFLTAPQGRLTITIGSALPLGEEAALAEFARALGRICDESPFEIDALTWWNRLGPR